MRLPRAGRRDHRVDERLEQPARSRVEQAHGATAGRGRDAALVSDRDGDHSSRLRASRASDGAGTSEKIVSESPIERPIPRLLKRAGEFHSQV